MLRFFNALLFFCAVLLISCDGNSDQPGNAAFFHKVYDGLYDGDIKATTVIETSDGGFLIVGTTYNLDEPEELLLIKTDYAGNVEWQQGYNEYLGPGLTSEAKTLLEGNNGYIVGGIIDKGSVKNSILFRVDPNGNPSSTDSILIRDPTFPNANYMISSVTLGPSGLVVAGTTDQLGYGVFGGTNGFLSVYNESLDGSINGSGLNIFGLEGDEEIVGAFEVDPAKIGPDGSQYLVFGTITGNTTSGNKNFFLEIMRTSIFIWYVKSCCYLIHIYFSPRRKTHSNTLHTKKRITR